MVILYFVPVIGVIWTIAELGFFKGTPGPNDAGQPSAGLFFRKHTV